MERQSIDVLSFCIKPHHLWHKQWLLLTSGDFQQGDFNSMTVGWGSLGTMWGMPFAQVVVRPTRYTYQFMQRYESFSLTAFPEAYRDALNHLGTVSGRDGDKISETELTPIACQQIAAPAFAQAELILECRKLYWEDMDPARFLDPEIQTRYPKLDYHRIYYGEILAIEGVSRFRCA